MGCYWSVLDAGGISCPSCVHMLRVQKYLYYKQWEEDWGAHKCYKCLDLHNRVLCTRHLHSTFVPKMTSLSLTPMKDGLLCVARLRFMFRMVLNEECFTNIFFPSLF